MNTSYIISNKYKNKDSIRLNLNEFDFQHPDLFYENLINSIYNDKVITHYTNLNDNCTIDLLRLISNYNNVNVNNILLTAGSDDALEYILNKYINVNSNILILRPTYDYFDTIIDNKTNNIYNIPIMLDDNNNPYSLEYHFQAYENELRMNTEYHFQAYENELRMNPEYHFQAYENELRMNLSEDKELLSETKCKIIQNNSIVYIVNPNNPLGVYHNVIEIENLLKKYTNAIFIIDEAYIEFGGLSSIELIKKYNNIFITRTFSKAYGLAGMRLGYILSSENNINDIKTIYNEKSLIDITKNCGIFILNNINYYNNIIDKIKVNKKNLEDFFKEHNIYYIPSYTNFITFYVGTHINKFIEILEENNIYIRIKPKSINMKGFARISIGNKNNMNHIQQVIKDNIELIDHYTKIKRYFIDGCFDGYHYGHINAFLESKNKCNILICGTHSDEELHNIKGDSLFDFNERLFMLKHCKYIDIVIDEDVPYITNLKTLDKYNCTHFLHGDETLQTINKDDPLFFVKNSNRYITYPITKGISTTQLLKRLYQYSNKYNIEYNNDIDYLMSIFNKTQKYLSCSDSFVFSYTNVPENSSLSTLCTDKFIVKQNNSIIIYDSWDLLHSLHIKKLMEIKNNIDSNLKIIALVSSNNNNCIYSQLERAIIISSIKEIDDVILENNNINEYNYINLDINFDKDTYIQKLIEKINNSSSLLKKLNNNEFLEEKYR